MVEFIGKNIILSPEQSRIFSCERELPISELHGPETVARFLASSETARRAVETAAGPQSKGMAIAHSILTQKKLDAASSVCGEVLAREANIFLLGSVE